MKHFFTFIAFLSVFILSGCSNDDDSADTLNGTTWVYVDTYSWGNIACEDTFTLIFGDQSFTGNYISKENGVVVDTETVIGTYIYDHPNIILKTDNETESGTVSGSKMTFISDGDEMVYTKK